MKRNYEIKVRLTRDEWKKLNSQVERTCLSREQYVRDVLAGVVVRERPPVEYGEIIIHLRAMTNTLRDLARLTRHKGEVPSKQLSAFAEQLERFDKTFVTSFI